MLHIQELKVTIGHMVEYAKFLNCCCLPSLPLQIGIDLVHLHSTVLENRKLEMVGGLLDFLPLIMCK